MKSFLLLLVSTLAISFAYAQPSYDDCATAFDLGEAPICPIPTIFTNVDATESFIGSENIPTCFNGGTVQRDVWLSFITPAAGGIDDFEVTITSVAGGTGILMPQVALYRGDCEIDGLAELLCASAVLNGTSVSFQVFDLTPSTLYFLRINDYSASASSNAGEFQLCIEEYIPDVNMGDQESTEACSGTLYDSGGPDAAYQNGENLTFTICPNVFHQCIFINVVNYAMENGFDDLNIYAGDNIGAPQLVTLTGTGGGVEVQAASDCVTIQFTSDGSITNTGFQITWECTGDTCTVPPITSCDEPYLVGSLPFNAEDLSTCSSGNTVNNSPCGNDGFLNGNDFVMAYESPGDECITVGVTGANAGTGVLLTLGCPTVASSQCISVASGNAGNTNPSIGAAFLEDPGTYYIVVSNNGNCTPFNIEIDTTSCPLILPNAGYCDDAIPLLGCDEDIPAVLAIQPGVGDPNFIQQGVNNGCIFAGPFNYTFFYFQAGADGQLGFTMYAANPAEASDIDFSVWGPFDSIPDACDYMENNQPVRSSYAGGADITGLGAVHPINGYAITDEYDCNGVGVELNDDMVSLLDVEFGKYYFVWINDWGNQITQGGISIGFDGTTTGVLDAVGDLYAVSGDTVLCIGESAQLNSTGGSLYNWAPATGLSCVNCPNPIAMPDETTTYTVSIYGGCGAYSQNVEVEVYDVKAGPDLTVCLGEEIQIVSGSTYEFGTYSWSPAIGLSCTDCPDPIVSAIAPGNQQYIVTLMTPNCILSDTMVLSVLNDPAPLFDVADDISICIGESVDLDGTNIAGATYAWTSDPPGFVSNDNNPVVSPTTTTTYYVSVNNGFCPLPGLDSVQVTVYNNPVISVANDTSVCQGSSVILGYTTTETGVTYSWTPAVDLDDNEIANPLSTPEGDHLYILEAINGACEVYDTVDVNVVQIAVNITNPDQDTFALCQGSIITLQANASPAGTLVHWSASTGLPVDSVTNNITVQPLSSTLYTASVSVPGCIRTETIFVAVDSLPDILDILPDDSIICQGQLIVLQTQAYEPSAFPNIEHSWTPLAGQQSSDTLLNLVIQPSVTTTYIRVTENGLCTSVDSATITVIPVSGIMVTPTDPVVCAGDPVQLTASGTGVTDFTWTPPTGLSCTDCPNPIATVSTTSTFTVTGEVQGCPTGGAVTVTIAPSPTYQFPSDQSLCLGESVTLNEAPANFTYNWTSSNNTLNTTDDSPSVTPSQTTTYYLTISNGSCDRTDSVTIVVNSQSLNLSEDVTLCIGNSAVLTGTTTGSGNYQWSTGETTSSITVSPTQNTTYDVVYTYGDGCTLQGQVVVSVADNFAIDLAATPDVTEVVQGDDIQLDVSVTGTATNPSYAWTENGTALAATGATVTVTPIVNPTTYAVTVTSQEGCSNTAEIVFTVLEPEWEIPNAFSPNGDEINDVFKVVFKNENNIQTLRFQVFNRWGQKVYDWTTGEPGWDGKLNGNDQPAEVYLYYIELQLGTGEVVEEKGDLTLIR